MRSTQPSGFPISSARGNSASRILRPRPRRTGSKPNARNNGYTKSTPRSRTASRGRTRAEAEGGIEQHIDEAGYALGSKGLQLAFIVPQSALYSPLRSHFIGAA